MEFLDRMKKTFNNFNNTHGVTLALICFGFRLGWLLLFLHVNVELRACWVVSKGQQKVSLWTLFSIAGLSQTWRKFM